MASFRKRYHNWEFRLFYIDRRTGERKEYFASGFRTKKAAELAAADMEQRIRRGFDPGEADQTLESYLNWWFETYKQGAVTPNTEKNIKNCLNMVIRNIGYMKLSELDRPAYQRFINKISPDYAKSTLQRMNTTIREAFLDAMDAGLIHSNPASRTKYPTTAKKSKKKEEKFLELDEYVKLIKAATEEWQVDYPQYLYMTYLLVGTGARIGEICALRLSDFDEDKCTLNLDKTLVREGGEYKTKETTKTGESGERVIGLDDFTVEKLKEWLHIRNTWVVGIKKRPDFLFINPLGDFIKMPNYGEVLKTLCSRNNIMHTTPHMFRHTHETIMWEAGISDLNYIGGRLGDVDKTILLETYGHMSNRSAQLNNEKINEFMKNWSSKLEGIN